MSITVSNGTGYIEVDYGTGRVETLRKGSFRTVVKEPYLYLVFDNVDNIFPKYTYGTNAGLMYDKIELLYTDVGTPSEASATALRDTILGWDGVALLPSGAATSAKQLANDHDVTVSNMIPAVETGLATSAKQLADDHNVTVSNMISDVETGLAKDATLTDASQKTQIVDDSGNVIESHLDSDGGYHLGACITQSVYPDPNNTSTDNLDAGNSYTFTGIGTSTLGVVGLQWGLKTDQNATVYIEESNDNSNWDISYAFDYIASKGGRGETVQAALAYWRIRVVLINGTDTTYFRLSGVLCPIATPLPSELSPDGRLKSENTITGQQNTNRHAWVSPTNALSTISETRLVGTNFDGSTKDTNFWSEVGTVNGGTVVQSGEIKLQTNTTANGTAMYYSVRKARFVVGSALKFVGAFRFNTAGTANNLRRCGAYDDDNGFFFQLNGTVFGIGTRSATSDTIVNTGSFNGNLGTAFTPNIANYYKLDIEWTPLGAFYYVNGILLHQVVGGHNTRVLSLPIKFENVNSSGSTSDVIMDCLGAVIMREGPLATNPTYKHISTNATYVCKIGAGKLHGIAINDPSAACTLTVYDNTSAAGTTIAIMSLTTKVITPFFMNYQLPFSTGLTIVTSAASDFTIIYE